ncbi:MAG: hypothetical protein IT370_01110 [Deltaproteobacteria bacterium]|nr:hypothetical protein [Deltaproteobacteria bacterium]
MKGAPVPMVVSLLAVLLGAAAGCGMVQQSRRNRADAASCERGDGRACMRQGDLWRGYRTGPNREPDALQRTLAAYQRACDGGVVDGCLRLVALYGLDPELAGERARGGQFALRACELGSAAGCGLAAGEAASDAARVGLVRRSCDLDLGRCVGAAEAIADLPEQALQLARRACVELPTQCVAATRFARSAGERGELLGMACAAGLLQHCPAAARELEQAGAHERARELARVGCRGGEQASCATLGQLLATPAGP